ncbi:stage II sporulation protein M [Bacillus sp. FJAT-27225]|uniref:stage II sporulation protein M n=1 Tax=Bacillus sp. FJAT-27225 TaxID=1743144 RepID=UPI00080C3051|nr:stage II sporulation protein M [Bacillus sp. FJAT-27225]OCA90994.1 stage II sporulation protein M [Bacillus sp. FJAT-27225]
MKKRMNQSIAAAYLGEHSSIFLFVSILFMMGVIFGAIIVNSMNIAQKEDLFYYLTQFFGQIAKGETESARDLFFQSLVHNSKFISLMWVLGISIIGLPIILILLFIKGMVVGFTVGFLVSQMGWDGFIFAFVSILPQNVIIIPVFIIMSAVSIVFSLKMIRRQFFKKVGQPVMPLFGRYVAFLAIALVLLAIGSGIEAYLSPGFMKIIAGSL